ncbi:PAS domain-containing protein [Pedobacter hartonius]|uniref:histidine kinase n=1 Tax=Pedobacter hartonius TaxID=425514 RepID=A0A1H4G7U1_9SPHI|nr:PAS domain-containing protein [Pedobacter hartonius]SEB05351.1 PAS domain S-box-containing protein [Pedobacter hartonius]
MNNQYQIFTDKELIEILSLSPAATAVYSTEEIIIQTANNAMLNFWGKNKDVIGKPLEVAVPELQGQQFIELLKNVWNTGITYQAFDTATQLPAEGNIQTFYYDFTCRALKNEAGAVYCILHTATDVTERNQHRQAMARARELTGALENEQALNEELMAANEELFATNEEMHNMQQSLSELNDELEKRVAARVKDLTESKKLLNEILHQLPAPVAVLSGANQVIELTNASILSFWNKTREEVTGRPMLEVFPELQYQPFPGQWKQVLETGNPIANREKPVVFNKEEGPRQYYVDYYYQPLTDYNGHRTSIMATVIDVTDKVESRQQLEENQIKLLDLNDELSTMNEEMAATNEELITTNEELAGTREDLLKTVREVEKSEARFRFLVQQAPTAICILNGPELIIESVNDMMLTILGKSPEITGKKYAEVLPEFKTQPYLQLLNEVFATGKPYFGNEEPTTFEQNGYLRIGYYNFIFQPVQNEQGLTTTIMIVATDVTEQVISRKQLQRAEGMLRLSIEAANVGTWFLNNKTREFFVSAQLKELFGYQAGDEISYMDAIAHIPESHRSDVLKAMGSATVSDTHYNIEFPIIANGDGNLRWVKALGKIETENGGAMSHFSGVIMDITEQKEDELRKNDFIGMVSHELKTPLTSLNGYTQILQQKALKTGDRFTISALEKVTSQIKKMTSLINGFLNISRLESGKIHLQKEYFYLDELVNELIEETRLTSSSHQISPSVSEHVRIYADRDKIGSVISNLLSNAVKYSPQAKDIEVFCELKNGQVRFSVKDHGMGIKPHDLEKLFDRFYRVEGSENQHISGFGIGLYLSAEIIERHDGNIAVTSEIGKGSTFYFNLPVTENE